MNAASIAALAVRRFRGEFFTPPLWTNEAHEEVSRVLGEDWRQECVVWDCAAGTGNLTRDYLDWGCLLSSTLEGTDVAAVQEQGWGGEHVFEYDFLNPGPLPLEAQACLQTAAAVGKRLVFFINPPYAEDGIAGAKGEARGGVAAETAVAARCREAGVAMVVDQTQVEEAYISSTSQDGDSFDLEGIVLPVVIPAGDVAALLANYDEGSSTSPSASDSRAIARVVLDALKKYIDP